MMFRVLAGVGALGLARAQYYDTAGGYESGSSYGGGGGYDSSSYDSSSYPDSSSYQATSYGDSSYQATSYQGGTSYGASEVHPFVDAWFTFNKKDGDTTAFKNSAARVSISKGKNDILVLDHIFEDTEAFIAANGVATNVDCSTRDLVTAYPTGGGNGVANCVHSYEIGVQLAAGTSTKKYGKNDAYSKTDPAIVSISEYGKLPVDIPAVQMNCVEINDAPNSQGVWADFSLESTVSLKSAYGSSYGYSDYSSSGATTVKFSDDRISTLNTGTTPNPLNPPIFARANNKAIWHARGSPAVTYSGTCAVTNGASFDGPVEAALPCAPVLKNSGTPITTDNPQCAGPGGGEFAYCSGLRSVSGCYPGCQAGVPTLTAPPLITEYAMGFCGYPTLSACVNKPRSLHCTAVIELGTVKSYGGGYGGGYGGY